ncbi:pyridoxal phosphate-dependent aminotransferase [Nitratireductor luteus]|uniref:pyridoxal phosphate-dependent aminotransferase n=1 Tax=Nitratireductor luteus TaxID=2976980 RepID=UPI0022408C12|nr:pyridoxal phosphate-dependent aminotransferase [Nitratireductor luteus]
MTERPSPTELVRSLPATVPFVGPETQERERGRPFRARLGANENGFGPAPSVARAMAGAAPQMWKYGDAQNHDLRNALARHLSVGAENIVIGEGIDGLLGLVVRQYVEQGAPVVTSLGAYPTFNYHVAGFGGRLVTVPYRDDREDLEGLLDAVKLQNAPLVYLSNPDNPMGTWWEADAVEDFIDALPPTTMFVLDEAYGETAPQSTLPALDISRPNVLRMRTFSKVYGLAGLRCGYAIGEAETIRNFEKVRNHFGMTRMAQEAALSALEDQGHLHWVCGEVEACRQRLYRIASENGLTPLISATNFVTMDCGRDGAYAMKVLQELGKRDVFVRKPMAPGIDRCIRVSVGPAEEINVFEAKLPEALKAVE